MERTKRTRQLDACWACSELSRLHRHGQVSWFTKGEKCHELRNPSIQAKWDRGSPSLIQRRCGWDSLGEINPKGRTSVGTEKRKRGGGRQRDRHMRQQHGERGGSMSRSRRRRNTNFGLSCATDGQRGEILTPATKWIRLEDTLLSEMNVSQKGKYCTISFI